MPHLVFVYGWQLAVALFWKALQFVQPVVVNEFRKKNFCGNTRFAFEFLVLYSCRFIDGEPLAQQAGQVASHLMNGLQLDVQMDSRGCHGKR